MATKQSPATQRERAEATAVVYRRVIQSGGRPFDAVAALQVFWGVDRPRAGGLLWEAGALGLIPQFYAPKRGR